jgi:hypothetical protein
LDGRVYGLNRGLRLGMDGGLDFFPCEFSHNLGVGFASVSGYPYLRIPVWN